MSLLTDVLFKKSSDVKLPDVGVTIDNSQLIKLSSVLIVTALIIILIVVLVRNDNTRVH